MVDEIIQLNRCRSIAIRWQDSHVQDGPSQDGVVRVMRGRLREMSLATNLNDKTA